ncbi:unnamed protein product [Peronospora belbahrii]|uniref:Uncharacterized protein n=1 Tax=Peronospora belbahrii TaxID=622444 RepID=A0ABN8DAZ3_9STRA|nr:unnamed protein product [Peronospora belbahrii]
MVARQRKSRTTANSKRDKEQNVALETADVLTRKKARVALQDVEELSPEPIAQHVARLELKVQELGEENARLKEQVEKLEKKQRDDKTVEPKCKSNLKRKRTAKVKSREKVVTVRALPKRKGSKI